MTKVLGYARAPTASDDLSPELEALRAAGCTKIYAEDVDAGAKQPALGALLNRLKAGDVLVVWRPDRLGRSLRQIVELVERLEQQRVGLCCLTEGIDTTQSGGDLVFSVFGALSRCERALFSERTRAGMDAARARGRIAGRQPALSPDQVSRARELYLERQHTVAEIAEMLGVSEETACRALGGKTDRSTYGAWRP